MFWIILFIISLILAITTLKKYLKTNQRKPPIAAASYICITVFSMFIFMVQGIDSITDYPYLTRQLAQIEALQHRLQDIKEASYTYKQDGSFVAGSIENINQSTNLSKYITDLSKKEAKYNGYLQEAKIYKKIFILYFFGDGWAISGKIYDLPKVTEIVTD
jgi:hypothetical protein